MEGTGKVAAARGNAPAVPINQDACFRTFFALRQDAGQTKVLYSYPMKQHLIMSQYPGLDRFCFPTLINGTPIAGGGDCTFVFVLTDDGGQRQFGHCANTVNNEAYVIISKLPWVAFFRNILYSYRANGAEMGQKMIRDLYGAMTPVPGEIFAVRPSGMLLRRPFDFPHAQFVDTNPSMLLDIFTDTQICQIVSSLLLDQNIIVMGPDFGTVSRIILALLGLLSPMEWQHIIVSIVTPNLVEVLSSPTPFLVGIVTEQREAVSKVMIEAVVYIEVEHVETKNSSGASAVAASRVLWGREDTREITCSRISYLNEAMIPLPRSGSVFNSTLKKSLRALRTTSHGIYNTQADSSRISEDMCRIFMQYYAKHFGMVGSTDFTFDGFLADLAAGIDPVSEPGKARKARKCPRSEQEFYEMFAQSQGSNGLRLFIQDRIADGTWSDNEFCCLAMQLNESYFREQLLSYKQSNDTAFLKPPPVRMTGVMSILFGGEGSGGTERGGRRKKRSLFSRWCLRGDDGDVSSGQDEMDDIRRISDLSSCRGGGGRDVNNDSFGGGGGTASLSSLSEQQRQLSRRSSYVKPSNGGRVDAAVSPSVTRVLHQAEAPTAVVSSTINSPPEMIRSSDVSPDRTDGSQREEQPAGAAVSTGVVTVSSKALSEPLELPITNPTIEDENETSSPTNTANNINNNTESVAATVITTNAVVASSPATVSSRVSMATPPEIGRSRLAKNMESPSIDFSNSNGTAEEEAYHLMRLDNNQAAAAMVTKRGDVRERGSSSATLGDEDDGDTAGQQGDECEGGGSSTASSFATAAGGAKKEKNPFEPAQVELST